MIIFGIPSKKKNEEGFQAVYEKYYPIVYKQLFYLCGSNRLADDLAQEVFLKYYHNKDKNIQYIGAWLSKVAVNTTYNYMRGENKRRQREGLPLDEAVIEETSIVFSMEDEVIRSEEIRRVRNILKQLPQEHRTCLILKFSGYSYDEIHQSTGIPKNNISQLIARGKQKFIDLYEKEGDSHVLHQCSASASSGQRL